MCSNLWEQDRSVHWFEEQCTVRPGHQYRVVERPKTAFETATPRGLRFEMSNELVKSVNPIGFGVVDAGFIPYPLGSKTVADDVWIQDDPARRLTILGFGRMICDLL